tara:strand:- start:8312 stop:8488 length:177 start_codon:yes stop_codon:yes gene_type:complete
MFEIFIYFLVGMIFSGFCFASVADDDRDDFLKGSLLFVVFWPFFMTALIIYVLFNLKK